MLNFRFPVGDFVKTYQMHSCVLTHMSKDIQMKEPLQVDLDQQLTSH